MKRTIILLYLGFSGILFSQGVLEKLFYDLPSEYIFDNDLEWKKSVIEEMKLNMKEGNGGGILDEKNGYLEYVGYQCSFQMCYWTIQQSDQTKRILVGVIEGCQDKPVFLIQTNEGLKPYNVYTMDVFESFNSAYFFKETAKIGEIRDFLDWYYFSLPRKGFNITVTYSGLYGQQEKTELLKGDKIDFIWNNGGFTMGQPYFSK